jgi:hypothetical protein
MDVTLSGFYDSLCKAAEWDGWSNGHNNRPTLMTECTLFGLERTVAGVFCEAGPGQADVVAAAASDPLLVRYVLASQFER